MNRVLKKLTSKASDAKLKEMLQTSHDYGGDEYMNQLSKTVNAEAEEA